VINILHFSQYKRQLSNQVGGFSALVVQETSDERVIVALSGGTSEIRLQARANL